MTEETSEPARGNIRYNGGHVEIYNGTAWGLLGARQAFGNMLEIRGFLDLNGEQLITQQDTSGNTTTILTSRTPQGIIITREVISSYGVYYFNNVIIEIPQDRFERVFTLGGEHLDLPLHDGSTTIQLDGHGRVIPGIRTHAEFVRDLSGTTPSIPMVDYSASESDNQPVLEIRQDGNGVYLNRNGVYNGLDRYGLDRIEPKQTSFKGVFEIDNEDELREFKKSKGLFKRGIKKFQALPFDEQVTKINKMIKVVKFNEENKSVKLELGWAGRYEVWLKSPPIAERIEKKNKRSDRNPFLSDGDLCLGNMKSTYNKCFENGNFLEALKLVISVLICKKDSKGYKRWSACKLKK